MFSKERYTTSLTMRKIGIFITVLLLGMQLTAQPTFAQRKTNLIVQAPNANESVTTPTPTPNKTAPTSTPTAVPTKAPVVPTATPTPDLQSTGSVQSTDTAQPTPTPQIISPLAAYIVTPTPKPNAVATTAKKKTPPTAVSNLMAAPLALAKTVLPASYYDEQQLAPRTTNMLLLFAFSSMFFGIILLAWPYLVELKERIFAAFHREDKIVYLHNGKGLLKA